MPKENNLRPDHYKKGEDTFAWAEKKFGIEYCLAICAFNIHKYNDRDKGEDFKDFGKIADYAMWARDMIERHKTEVTSVKSPKREYAPDSHFNEKDLVDSDELTYGEHERAKKRGKENSSIECWLAGSDYNFEGRNSLDHILLLNMVSNEPMKFLNYSTFFKWFRIEQREFFIKNGPDESKL